MNVATETSDSSMLMAISGECTIDNAARLLNVLTEALQSPKHLVLNVENVTAADLSFLQLLCWAHKTSVKSGKNLALLSANSAPLRRTVEEAGFSRSLGCKREFSRSCLWTELNNSGDHSR